ncbi:MAG: hypothetical protein GY861_02745 [bacterium]|nr:hypothetical protein [bacterium]
MEDEKDHALLDLINTECQLYHHPKDPPTGPAVDYIVQHIGKQINEVESEIAYTLRIPICQECLNAISSGEWYLLFCIHCLQSRWILAKLSHRKHDTITWLDECPECLE